MGDDDTMPPGYSRMDEGPTPSLKLLFAYCTHHDKVTLLLPAIGVSLLSGGIAPFMTRVIGQAFDAFARFPLPAAQADMTPEALTAAKSRLLHEVGITAIELLALAGGALLLSSAMSSLWIWVAERNVMRLRRSVYEAVTHRRMEWFDAQMAQAEGDMTGAGGMMAKFARDTDDIRNATSLAMGQLIQHITTVLAALALALATSWALTLIILASIPILLFLQGASQAMAMPRYDAERNLLARAATVTTTCLAAIATIKAFNAQSSTRDRLSSILHQARKTAHACSAIWGVTAGGTQFVLFGMFVQGFWFGSLLVRQGHISPGQVMGVFWACLIAASNLQMCIPLIVAVSKGKSAAVAVAALLDPLARSWGGEDGKGPMPIQAPGAIPLVRAPTHRIPMRKIIPTRKCQGELGLHNVTFAYPSRPDQIVLKNVSIFIPANEMTFVVGGSGSGKSTVAQVMCGMYKIRNERARPQSQNRSSLGIDSKADAKLPVDQDEADYFAHTPGGMVVLDDQQLDMLDERWTRKNVALVSQQCILFDMSVHDNVAIGLAGSRLDDEEDGDDDVSDRHQSTPFVPRVSRDKVVEACRMALLHEFIRDLPQDYDTILNGGGGGAGEAEAEESGNGRISLSGGQRQRLAIARAWIRDPAVLILDEATSALDVTSRILVFEAIKAWRRNKTTIVITHDLSQIAPEDFVYVMKDGQVVQEGYRYNLQAEQGGVFEGMGNEYQGVGNDRSDSDDEDEIQEELRGTASLHHSMRPSTTQGHSTTRGYTDNDSDSNEYAWGMVTHAEARQVEEILDDGKQAESQLGMGFPASSTRHLSFAPYVQHPSLAGPSQWMLDAIADISGNARTPVQSYRHRHPSVAPLPLSAGRPRGSRGMRSSVDMAGRGLRLSAADLRRASLQWEPQSPTSATGNPQSGWPGAGSTRKSSIATRRSVIPRWTRKRRQDADSESDDQDSEEEETRAFEQEKNITKASGMAASQQRRIGTRGERKEPIVELIVEQEQQQRDVEQSREVPPTLTSIVKRFYPTVPNKPLVLFGLLVSLASGAMTPLFSFLLATLMSEVAAGGRNIPLITKYALLVLLAAAGDGITGGLKFYIMEVAAMNWVTSLRERCFERILVQDKRWHDEPAHSPAQIAQVLIKDGDDARTLIAVVIGQCITVMTMVSVGLVWAMVMGWQLTLVGFAVGPVFGLVMVLQVRWSGQIELRNKRAREQVAKQYYNAVANVRAIRAMALESVFRAQFEQSLERAMKTGVQGAFITGCGFGIVNALIYIAEAALFFVGAVLMAREGYSYLRMLQALNLVVFSVTIAAQLLSFVPRIVKSVQATHDFGQFLDLDTVTDESKGDLRFPVEGRLTFDHVQFAYPAQPEAPILRDVSFQVDQGECVAIVGPSGCGKSTIASLIQRLYEPTGGSIRVNKHAIAGADVRYLREHIAVVSQHPALFDASVTENILFGSTRTTLEEVQNAAKAAQMHDWIMSQERGYETMLGEGAALISGGQAQRLQIARALVRQANILIMDEATSALDPANQDAIMDTVLNIKQDRITLVVTHKLAVMQRCDRILVVQDGVIAEEGPYQELMNRRGAFFSIASAGEWFAE